MKSTTRVGSQLSPLSLMLLLGALTACQGLPQDDNGTSCSIRDPAGPIVENSAVGGEDEEATFQRLWQIGGLDDAPLLVAPLAIAVDRNGRAAIADAGLSELNLVDANGVWEGTVARRGEGPGEILGPVALSWADDGVLLVMDVVLARVTELNLNTGGRRTFPVDPALVIPAVSSGQIGFAALQPDLSVWLEIPGQERFEGWEERVIARSTAGRIGITEVARGMVRVMGRGPYRREPMSAWPRTLVGVGRTGWVVADSTHLYELKAFDGNGEVVAHFCYPAVGEGLSEIERGEAVIENQPSDLPLILQEAGEPQVPAVISRILIDTDDRVWIQRDRTLPWDSHGRAWGAASAMHDVFLASGEYLGSARMPEGHRLQASVGDRVWTFHVGELGEFSVASFLLEW